MDSSILSKEDEKPPLDDRTFKAWTQTALVDLKEGKYEDACIKFDHILDCGSQNFQLLAAVYMWYGRALRKMGNYEKALSYFKDELLMYQFTNDLTSAGDLCRRIVHLHVIMGNISKAIRAAHDFIDLAKDKDDDMAVATGKMLILKVCLNEAERGKENKAKMMEKAELEIIECKALEECENDVNLTMLEGKYQALLGNYEEAKTIYNNAIAMAHGPKNYEVVHKCYSDLANFCQQNTLLCIIDNLRSAIYYAKKCANTRPMIEYTIELSYKLGLAQQYHEGYLQGLDALEMSRDEKSNGLIFNSITAISSCLIGLEKLEKAAYFLVFGCILAVTKKCDSQFEEYYKMMDKVMGIAKNAQKDEETVEISVDASDDPMAENDEIGVMIKLEHTTTLETWRMIISDIMEKRTKVMVKEVVVVEEEEENKENEPTDFMDLIERMHTRRMDDQRSALPIVVNSFQQPSMRPTSSMSKKKSHRLMPGLKVTFQKLQDTVDPKALKKLMSSKKAKNKSKVSVGSDSTSVNAGDADTLCSTSLDSRSLNNTVTSK